MTIHIDGTFINGVLFGIYMTGVVFLVLVSYKSVRNDEIPLWIAVGMTITWPVSVLFGLLARRR